jgi:hypothetical protein
MLHPVWPVCDEPVSEEAAVPGCLCILLYQVVLGWVLEVQRVTDALRGHIVTHTDRQQLQAASRLDRGRGPT